MSTSAPVNDSMKAELDTKIDTTDAPQSQAQAGVNRHGGNDADDERVANVPFHCISCELHELVHYFGKQPPFVFGIEFCEPTYVMRDPFQAPLPSRKSKAEYFVAMGAHCRICNNIVCKDMECSFYYMGTHCLQCARKCASTFPLDVQQKLRKLI